MQKKPEELLEGMNQSLDILYDAMNTEKNVSEKVNNAFLDQCLNALTTYEKNEKGKRKIPNLKQEIESVTAALENVRSLVNGDMDCALKKIRYELIPLTENMRMDFHYYTWIYYDEEKRDAYPKGEMKKYFRNPYMEEAKRTGKYKYDVSIVIIGYNKLEYTKLCVESLLRYKPQNFSYELILLNHGSTDGTKEYFESIKPDKQLDVAVNGGGANALYTIMEGKYALTISNDIILTRNAVDNLYKCITSDEKIAWVVPTTPNVSNLQTIPANYENMEEMFAFAEKNNISSEQRWEERVRLCNPIDIYRSDLLFQHVFGRKHLIPAVPFPDDKMSMFYRRAGYKLILAKDAYCYHFGSVTLGEENRNNQTRMYTKGRIDFIKDYGMDPWGYGFCYAPELFRKFQPDKLGEVNIMGVNSGLGSNILKIKELLKENVDNRDVWMTGVSFSMMNKEDLESICEEAVITENWDYFKEESKRKYDYILLENEVDKKCLESLEYILKWRKKDGVLILRVEDNAIVNAILRKYRSEKIVDMQGYSWIKL